MFLNFLYLITSIFGYISIYIMGFNFKSNRHTNAYLIFFFFLSSTRFLFYGMPNIPFNKSILLFLNLLFTLTFWPCLYLYFMQLINKKTEIKARDSLHFLLPLLIVLFVSIKYLGTKSNAVIMFPLIGYINLSINIWYYCLTYNILSKNIWYRNNEIKLIDMQDLGIHKWTTFLFVVFSINFLRVLINNLIIDNTVWSPIKNDYLWFGALVWIFIYIRILSNPELLFGYEELQTKMKKSKSHSLVLDKIWKIKCDNVVLNVQDAVLKEKIGSSIESYIIEINFLAFHSNLFFKQAFSADALANKLGTPKSHLLYVFKYHANVSFSDFKKIIRIQKAIVFMEDAYLKSNTMESLAIDVGFSSYSPFFKSFKTITGLSPQEYCNKVN